MGRPPFVSPATAYGAGIAGIVVYERDAEVLVVAQRSWRSCGPGSSK